MTPASTKHHKVLLTPQDIMRLPYNPAPYRLYYGEETHQFGDLRLPTLNTSTYPLLIIIHGGCWTSSVANLHFMSPFADAFTQNGFATWNIEYRCIDNGGGWPGTFQDVAKAIDHISIIAPQYNLNLSRAIVIGHSSGGHLALWAAARHKLASASPLYRNNPLPLKAAVNIGGPADLSEFTSLQYKACGGDVIERLLGLTAKTAEEQYAQTSPAHLLPFQVKQELITGDLDTAAPQEVLRKYSDKAKKLGDDVNLTVIPRAGHFEVVSPHTPAWKIIKKKIVELYNH